MESSFLFLCLPKWFNFQLHTLQSARLVIWTLTLSFQCAWGRWMHVLKAPYRYARYRHLNQFFSNFLSIPGFIFLRIETKTTRQLLHIIRIVRLVYNTWNKILPPYWRWSINRAVVIVSNLIFCGWWIVRRRTFSSFFFLR